MRLASELLERIEKTARDRGISPRRLIRAVLAERFGERSANRSDRIGGARGQQPNLEQILFDLTRTRLTLQHLLDQQLGSTITDQIRRTALEEAKRHLQRLVEGG